MGRLASLAAALALLVALVAGCGVGSTAEGEISETADTYLRALADGDSATACEQLTADARSRLGGGCEPALRQLASRVGGDRLAAAADGAVDIDADGMSASADVRELDVRLTLVQAGEVWRIDDGYRLDSE